jgi:hypothetical protein
MCFCPHRGDVPLRNDEHVRALHAHIARDDCERTPPFLSASPMFVPSLSW